MNHFGIGRLDHDKSLVLPTDVLKPLFIRDGALVHGMFYPPEMPWEKDVESSRFDFVLSVIPYDLWAKSCRLVIHTKHNVGSFRKIANVITENGASILSSEASRSAHSYDSWNIIVAFEDMKNPEKCQFNAGMKLFDDIVPRIERLRREIYDECQDILFADYTDTLLKNPATIIPLHAMHYFYNIVQCKQNMPSARINEDYLTWAHYKPFQLRCQGDSSLVSDDGEFKSIVEKINIKIDSIIPSVVFAEMDTDDANLRIVIIPKRIKRRFINVSARFIRSSPPKTSRGFTSHILDMVTKRGCNVWGLTNRTYLLTDVREEGKLDLIVERPERDEDRFDGNGVVAEPSLSLRCQEELKKYISENPLPTFLSHIDVIDIVCTEVSEIGDGPLAKRVEPHHGGKDVFISYSTKDGKEAQVVRDLLTKHGITVFLAEKDIPVAVEFEEQIREELCGAKDIIFLCSPNSRDSEWVIREYGAAWALKKRIVPIFFESRPEDFPEYIRKFHGTKFHLVNDEWPYITDILTRLNR